jgi:hypothetical protein
MLVDLTRLALISASLAVLLFVWQAIYQYGRVGRQEGCREACEALFSTYVTGTVYGCVCEERSLEDMELERASRRFMLPLNSFDILD